MHRPLVLRTVVAPIPQKNEIRKGEEKEERRQLGLAGGEIVLDAVVKVIDFGMNRHGDQRFGITIGEVEAVFIGVFDEVGVVEGDTIGGEVQEGEEVNGELGVKDAEIRVLSGFLDDLEEGLVGEEEKSDAGVGGGTCGGGGGFDGHAGNGDGDLAGVGKAEFLEQNHVAGVGCDFQVFNFRDGGGHEREERHGDEEILHGPSHSEAVA